MCEQKGRRRGICKAFNCTLDVKLKNWKFWGDKLEALQWSAALCVLLGVSKVAGAR